MARAPDHMSGINALPKWDPNNLSAGYRYDPANYDRADYAKFKEARAARDKAANAKSKASLKEAQQKFAKEFSRAIGDKVREAHAGRTKAKSRDQINQAVARGKTIYADVPSRCLASLSFHQDKDGNGVATAEFYRGGKIVYDYPMDLDEFLEWASGSLGEYGNAYVFD